MNKIILDKEKIVNLNINEDSICNINKNFEINEINIIINKNVKFIINHYSEIEENDLKINIVEKDNCDFVYNHSFRNTKKYNININVELIGNHSKNTININGVSDNGTSNIRVDGKVLENTNNNEIYETIKMLNINDGASYIYPNMFIDTKNVIANHAASITNIDEDYLFYLNSKGIDTKKAKILIIEGFLNNEAK